MMATMIRIRKAAERGHADYEWLKTFHTFSFGSYHDPKHTHFRALRVMNEDFVAPGKGFGTHPHDNMEIVTYVLEGALEHRDSMGNGEMLRPGEFQRMSAGTGITHSEFNPSSSDPVHLYQIWIAPAVRGCNPSYEQKRFNESARENILQRVASPDGAEGSLIVGQDVNIFLADIVGGNSVKWWLPKQRYGWVQVLRGSVFIHGASLEAGDGAAISDEDMVSIGSTARGEVMLFDLP
jgi:redox-sensitive bicupin YhaK (pirin superfamily)